MKKAVTIRFPAPLPAEITCPICEGNKCIVCKKTGKIKITVDAKVPIQRSLIIQYVVENVKDIAYELSRQYGLTQEVETEDMFTIGNATYELVKVSSLGGVVWIANRVDELESPRYFKSISDLQNFRRMSNEQ
tara:strand:+ start:362 stop:760 length:399 start_codon:yes stop_codon:yes gene_type:complete